MCLKRPCRMCPEAIYPDGQSHRLPGQAFPCSPPSFALPSSADPEEPLSVMSSSSSMLTCCPDALRRPGISAGVIRVCGLI